MCECQFHPDLEPDPDGTIPGPDEWCHYLRTCLHCGCVWQGLHCPHDGHQNPCPDCGIRPTPVEDIEAGPIPRHMALVPLSMWAPTPAALAFVQRVSDDIARMTGETLGPVTTDYLLRMNTPLPARRR